MKAVQGGFLFPEFTNASFAKVSTYDAAAYWLNFNANTTNNFSLDGLPIAPQMVTCVLDELQFQDYAACSGWHTKKYDRLQVSRSTPDVSLQPKRRREQSSHPAAIP